MIAKIATVEIATRGQKQWYDAAANTLGKARCGAAKNLAPDRPADTARLAASDGRLDCRS
jgi:hypothetical protein